MRSDFKTPKADLRKYYNIFFLMSLIIVLLFFLALTNLDLTSERQALDLTEEQEVVLIKEIVQTKHEEIPPPPPKPPVPVEVPNDEIIEDQILNIDAELVLDEKLEMPPLPSNRDIQEENFFVIVEQMPTPKGGLASIQQCVNYPEMAHRAGIEGLVVVQFVVDEEGKVAGEPEVIRGIGGGADKEAVRCVKQAEFIPGYQRGKAVKVQLSLPIKFSLSVLNK